MSNERTVTLEVFRKNSAAGRVIFAGAKTLRPEEAEAIVAAGHGRILTEPEPVVVPVEAEPAEAEPAFEANVTRHHKTPAPKVEVPKVEAPKPEPAKETK